MDIDYRVLGNNLKVKRESKNFTQEYILDLCPMSKSTYSKIENGKTNPSLIKIINIVNILNVSLSEMLGIYTSMPSIPIDLHKDLCSLNQINRLKLLMLIYHITENNMYYYSVAFEAKTISINKRVQQFLTYHHVSQNDLANILAITKGSAKNILSGNHRITIDGLYKIAIAYNVPIDVFLIDILQYNVIGIEFLLCQMNIDSLLKNKKIFNIIYNYIALLKNAE